MNTVKEKIDRLKNKSHTDTVDGLQQLFIDTLKNKGNDTADVAIHRVLRICSIYHIALELNLLQSTVSNCIKYARRMTNNNND